MAFQPALCDNCGGQILVDDVDLNGFAKCQYCHTSHKVIDIITIDGLPTARTLLINANNAMTDGNLDRATDNFKKILEIKPNCHEAYWGLYECQCAFDRYYGYTDKYGQSGPITRANMMLDALNKYAYRAIQYAPEKQKAIYKANIASDEQYIEDVRNGKYDKRSKGAGGCSTMGCYIATAVYGSYTCDEVMQLRRFRDEYLANFALGRMFIRLYYTISPAMVKHIRKGSLTERTIRRFLDWLRKRI